MAMDESNGEQRARKRTIRFSNNENSGKKDAPSNASKEVNAAGVSGSSRRRKRQRVAADVLPRIPLTEARSKIQDWAPPREVLDDEAATWTLTTTMDDDHHPKPRSQHRQGTPSRHRSSIDSSRQLQEFDPPDNSAFGSIEWYREGSNVLRLSPNLRYVHLASINPMSKGGTPLTHLVYRQASAWLAWSHLNDPDSHIIPSLKERLEGCDIRFTLDILDTEISQFKAASELSKLMGAIEAGPGEDEDRDTSTIRISKKVVLPSGLVGAGASSTSITLSTYASAFDLPLVSSMSSSSSLDDKLTHPLFARTVPTNLGDSIALIRYFQDIHVSHMAVLYVADGFGRAFHSDIVRQALASGIHVASFAFLDDDEESLEDAIQQLAASGRRYIVAILNNNWQATLGIAMEKRIIGSPDYFWLFTEFTALVDPSFSVNATTEEYMALALNGTGVLMIEPPENPTFDYILQLFHQSARQQQDFVSRMADSSFLEGFEWPEPGASHYQYMTYDAVMALAIASCECEQQLFTGSELYEQLKQTEFEGASGHVAFDPTTGTRQSKDFVYRIANVLISEARSGDGVIRFTTNTAVLIDHRDEAVQSIERYEYANGSVVPPAALPPLEAKLNLISTGVLATGLTIAGIVMLASAGFFCWTMAHRKKSTVRASQPLFLGQICIGTLITGSSVIPMAMQEPVPNLNVACMSQPWLVAIGFVTTISALLAKTWRLSKLFGDGKTLRRVKVGARDVMLPFVVLMTINLVLLTAWSIVSPLTWERVPVQNNVDGFGRSKESYGRCVSDSNKVFTGFATPIVVVNLCALVAANYLAYQTRKISTMFSESQYIGISMFSLLEAVIIGMPLLFLLSDNPTSLFLVRSILISISCLAILIPIFVPKCIHLSDTEFCDSMGMPSSAPRRGTVHVSVSSGQNGGRRVVSERASEVSGNSRRASTRSFMRSSRSHIAASVASGETPSSNSGDSRGGGLFSGSLRSSFRLSSRSMRPGEARVSRKPEYYAQRENDSMYDVSTLFISGPLPLEAALRSATESLALTAMEGRRASYELGRRTSAVFRKSGGDGCSQSSTAGGHYDSFPILEERSSQLKSTVTRLSCDRRSRDNEESSVLLEEEPMMMIPLPRPPADRV